MSTTYIDLDGKQYAVWARQDGTVDISVSWQGFNIADRGLARSCPIWRSRSLNLDGRIGKRVLAAYWLTTSAEGMR